MERNWLEVGAEYTSGADRARVEQAIEALRWYDPSEPGPLSPVLTLREVIREFHWPKVSAVGWGGGDANVLGYPDGPETAAYTVLGVEGDCKDGRVRLYVLDTGLEAIPVAFDFPVTTPALERRAEHPLFALGRIVATPGAIERMERYGIDPAELLRRHHGGDWGDIHPEDRGLNEEALVTGARIFSVYGKYEGGEDRRIWVITEADDRSSTCLLLPEEY